MYMLMHSFVQSRCSTLYVCVLVHYVVTIHTVVMQHMYFLLLVVEKV